MNNKLFGRNTSGRNLRSGFTLIELLVVVLIIGILSSIALPQYTKAVNKSRGAEALTAARAVRDAQNVYFLGNDKYSEDLGALDIETPELKYFAVSVGSGGSGWDCSDNYCVVKFTANRNDASLSLELGGSEKKQGYLYCSGADCQQYFSCTYQGADKTGRCLL